MKKYILSIFILAALTAVSCEKQDFKEADYNVRLNKENTYKAGKPVVFDIEGNVDNLIFYSGETDHQYKYYNRYVIAPEDIRKAEFIMNLQNIYGCKGGLEIFVTNQFDGLDGENAEADREEIRKMVESGMKGWKRFDYEDSASRIWTTHNFDLKDYVDKCVLAIHWKPVRVNPEDGSKVAQRTYWINADLVTDFGQGINKTNIRNIDWTCVMMNSPYYDKDPYITNKGNGYFNFNRSGADLIMQGVSSTDLDFDIDGWIISKPMSLTTVTNDKPMIIKDMQNYMSTFSYTWDKPGTYVVTFIGINTNYAGESEKIKEFKITILE